MDTGTFGELGSLAPWPLAISITEKQFEEKIYYFRVRRQVTLLTNESISMKNEMFLTNVVKVPGGTNSTSDGPKIYCLFNTVTGNKWEKTANSNVSLRNGGGDLTL